MKNFIERYCSAIATEEGYFAKTSPGKPNLPQRLNNPGDLRAAPWLQNAITQSGYWKAPSPQAGIAGLYHQVALDIARGKTHRQMISKWAPPAENATEKYIEFVAEAVGIPYVKAGEVEQPLWNFLEIQEIHPPG